MIDNCDKLGRIPVKTSFRRNTKNKFDLSGRRRAVVWLHNNFQENTSVQIKMNSFSLVILLVCCASSFVRSEDNTQVPAHDYVMTGYIENVFFKDRTQNRPAPGEPAIQCYVAVNDPSSGRNLYYHKSYDIDLCKFAEKVMTVKQKIDLYGIIFGDSNKIAGIQHSGTKSRFW